MNKPTVLITGAASGIGRATALRFATEGFDVCINDIQTEKLTALLQELPPGNHLVLPGSYCEAATLAQGQQLVDRNWCALDVLVNCAGISGQTDLFAQSPEEWRIPFDTMVNGTLLISKLAAANMHRGGRMIHITSIHGTRAEKGASSYAMAKAAINQLCRALAVELADRHILVNAIAPGFVDTPMSVVNNVNELESDWFKDNYINGHHLPLRRAARPEEIAGVAFFLAGKDASYITGQVIVVDGGLTITF